MPRSKSRKTTILFMAANPRGFVDELELYKEYNAIRDSIRQSRFANQFNEIKAEWGIRTDDILKYLLEHTPDILHFSGHGSVDGELIVHDPLDEARTVSPEAFSRLFASLKANIRLVVLNACFSRAQATKITGFVDCAIGTERFIYDENASVFAGAFYLALGFAKSVQEAFDLAKASVISDDTLVDGKPDLLTKKGISASELFFARQLNRPALSHSATTPSPQSGEASRSNRDVAMNPPGLIALTVRTGGRIDLLEALAPYTQVGSPSGFSELVKGEHFGKQRVLDLARDGNGVYLNAYPRLIDLRQRRKIASVRIQPASTADPVSLYEYRPLGDNTQVAITIRVNHGPPTSLTLKEQRERPRSVIIGIKT